MYIHFIIVVCPVCDVMSTLPFRKYKLIYPASIGNNFVGVKYDKTFQTQLLPW